MDVEAVTASEEDSETSRGKEEEEEPSSSSEAAEQQVRLRKVSYMYLGTSAFAQKLLENVGKVEESVT